MSYSVGIVSAAIYCRLSKDDGSESESCSIQNQKETLTEYVTKQGWSIYDVYIDDGYTGTNFDRPSFKRMIDDIEHKRVNLVITKDLSRLGRNYIQTGMYTEDYFPSRDVRYIALNDHFDSTKDDSDNDIAPFKNIMNEWYPKDISKKVLFTLDNKAKNGECANTVFPIYGCKYNEDFERIPDEVTAPVVRMVFEEYVRTKSSQYVVDLLISKRIVCPKYYAYLTTNYDAERCEKFTEEQKYAWSRSTIKTMIRRIEYLGHYVKGRYKKRSFKDKRIRIKKYEDAYVFKNRFPAIVPEELFIKANEIMDSIREAKAPKGNNIYKNVVVCDECLHSMTLQVRPDRNDNDRLICYNKKCHHHSAVSKEIMDKIVVKELTKLKESILSREEEFLEYTKLYNEKLNNKKEPSKPKHDLETIKKLENRYRQLSLFIKNLFENKISGDIPIELYDSMMKEYTSEQKTIVEQLNIFKANQVKEEKKDYYIEAQHLVKQLKLLDEDSMLTFEVIHAFFKQIRVYVDRTGNPNIKDKPKKFYITYNYLDEIVKDFINYEPSKQ